MDKIDYTRQELALKLPASVREARHLPPIIAEINQDIVKVNGIKLGDMVVPRRPGKWAPCPVLGFHNQCWPTWECNAVMVKPGKKFTVYAEVVSQLKKAG